MNLSQTKYAINLLNKTNLLHAKAVPTPMCVTSKLSLHDSAPIDAPSLYGSTVGALQYLTLSRPDLAFSVNRLSQYLEPPTLAHWKACKGVLRYIKGAISYGLKFRPTQIMNLEGYSDADWASVRKITIPYLPDL